MRNKYRLSSSVFERESEEEKEELEKIFFISVEGNRTEMEYLRGVSDNRAHLGMSGRIDVKVLGRSRKDTNSAPLQVVELLEEYLSLRALGRENLIEDIPEQFIEKYGDEFVEKYLDDPQKIPRRKRNAFETDLMKIGYNINYRKYLHEYRHELDEFCILIDRDKEAHSEADMLELMEYCKEKQYNCYVANPCFEFWLLLHLSDVEKEYADEIEKIRENKKISDHHTFVSGEVSKKAHHGKKGIHFKENYLPNVDMAIQRAKCFANSEEELVRDIGCNLWQLFEKMKSGC